MELIIIIVDHLLSATCRGSPDKKREGISKSVLLLEEGEEVKKLSRYNPISKKNVF